MRLLRLSVMVHWVRAAATVVTAGSVAACGSPQTHTATVTSTVTETTVSTVAAPATSPATTIPPTTPRGYTGNGVLSVGDQPSGGLIRSIPPGRYAVTINDGQSGGWIRCSSVLCGVEYQDNIIAIGNAFGPNYSAVMEIEPTDVAVSIFGVTLTPVS